MGSPRQLSARSQDVVLALTFRFWLPLSPSGGDGLARVLTALLRGELSEALGHVSLAATAADLSHVFFHRIGQLRHSLFSISGLNYFYNFLLTP